MNLEIDQLLTQIRDDKFVEIYGACSRKIRNMLEGKFLKKFKKKGKVKLKTSKDRKNDALAVRKGILEQQDSQMAEEILKTWLYGKRLMLQAALDFFEIPNEEGITEDDLTAMEEAEPDKLKELFDKLVEQGYKPEDVAIYLAFMQTKHFDETPALVAALKGE